MSVYAESSAVLAWLLDEPEGARVRERLARADAVLTSDLTLIECDRALHRSTSLGERTPADAAARRQQLATTSSRWTLQRIGPEVVARARQPFPGEPVRSLDAIHLASVLMLTSVLPDVVLLSLDQRVRTAGRALGIFVEPE